MRKAGKILTACLIVMIMGCFMLSQGLNSIFADENYVKTDELWEELTVLTEEMSPGEARILPFEDTEEKSLEGDPEIDLMMLSDMEEAQPYITGLAMMKMEDGTDCFDEDDDISHDTSAFNGRVRSYDDVAYYVAWSAFPQDDQEAMITSCTMDVRAVLPVSSEQAVFQTEVMSWLSESSIEEHDGMQILTGKYDLFVGGEACVVPGAGVVSIVVSVLNAGEGTVFAPLFSLGFEGGNTMEIEADPVTTTAKLYMNTSIHDLDIDQVDASIEDWNNDVHQHSERAYFTVDVQCINPSGTRKGTILPSVNDELSFEVNKLEGDSQHLYIDGGYGDHQVNTVGLSHAAIKGNALRGHVTGPTTYKVTFNPDLSDVDEVGTIGQFRISYIIETGDYFLEHYWKHTMILYYGYQVDQGVKVNHVMYPQSRSVDDQIATAKYFTAGNTWFSALRIGREYEDGLYQDYINGNAKFTPGQEFLVTAVTHCSINPVKNCASYIKWDADYLSISDSVETDAGYQQRLLGYDPGWHMKTYYVGRTRNWDSELAMAKSRIYDSDLTYYSSLAALNKAGKVCVGVVVENFGKTADAKLDGLSEDNQWARAFLKMAVRKDVDTSKIHTSTGIRFDVFAACEDIEITRSLDQPDARYEYYNDVLMRWTDHHGISNITSLSQGATATAMNPAGYALQSVYYVQAGYTKSAYDANGNLVGGHYPDGYQGGNSVYVTSVTSEVTESIASPDGEDVPTATYDAGYLNGGNSVWLKVTPYLVGTHGEREDYITLMTETGKKMEVKEIKRGDSSVDFSPSISSDGKHLVTYFLPNAPHNEILEPFYLRVALVDGESVENKEVLMQTTYIWAEASEKEAYTAIYPPRKAYTNISIADTNRVSLSKTVDHSIIGVNGAFSYEVKLENAAGASCGSFELKDPLPEDGDSRGSHFHGEIQVKNIEALSSLGQELTAEVKNGYVFVRGQSLQVQEIITLRYTIETGGNWENDMYANQAYAYGADFSPLNTWVASNLVKTKVVDDRPPHSLTIRKRVKAADLREEHGSPTFFFSVKRVDEGGPEITYTKALTYDEEDCSDEIVELAAVFENLPPGKYEIQEKASHRYELKEVKALSDNVKVYSNALTASWQAEADLTEQDGELVFFNQKVRWDQYSDTSLVVNHFGGSAS